MAAFCAAVRVTADVVPALVANANRVGVVVLAVCTDHPFRTAWLYRSVSPDHVVVADAELPAPLAMPRVYLSGRTHLVGFHCRTVDDNHGDGSHNCSLIHAGLNEERGDHQGNQ